MNTTYKYKVSAYIVGFLLSLYLTLSAYFLVTKQALPHLSLIIAVVALALVQFGVQIVFFLHIGEESKPRWNLVSFLSMMLMIAILVIGSIWIMANLNYHHDLEPAKASSELIKDEGLKPRH